MTLYVLFMKLNGGADKFLHIALSELAAQKFCAGYSTHPVRWQGLQGESKHRYFYIKVEEVVE